MVLGRALEMPIGLGAGRVVRAGFPDRIRAAYDAGPGLPSLLSGQGFAEEAGAAHGGRRAVAAAPPGVLTRGFSAAPAYYDALRAERLPAALAQGQRGFFGFFGAHAYRRTDREGSFHTLRTLRAAAGRQCPPADQIPVGPGAGSGSGTGSGPGGFGIGSGPGSGGTGTGPGPGPGRGPGSGPGGPGEGIGDGGTGSGYGWVMAGLLPVVRRGQDPLSPSAAAPARRGHTSGYGQNGIIGTGGRRHPCRTAAAAARRPGPGLESTGTAVRSSRVRAAASAMDAWASTTTSTPVTASTARATRSR